MTEDMPRPRPPYLQRHTTRHGKSAWYVRVPQGPLVRIRGECGSPEFNEAYEAAMRGEARPQYAHGRSGSLKWLYERYRESEAWLSLSQSTRKQREAIFANIMAKGGDEPFRAVKRKDIQASKDARKPGSALHFLTAMRGLFHWAKAHEHVDIDPTEGVRNPAKRRSSSGYPVWTDEDIAAYESRWAAGTKERVWLHVLLYTGLRCGDAVRLGRQHVRDGVATLRTEKTGMEVSIPILPALTATLKDGPCGDLAYICGARGEPLKKSTFGEAFSEAAKKAGVAKSAHGVRKAMATRAAENKATVAELEALFGWQGGRMASVYTKTADRARLAKSAVAKLAKGKTGA